MSGFSRSGLVISLASRFWIFWGVSPFSFLTAILTASYPMRNGSWTTSESMTPYFKSSSSVGPESKPTS